MKGYEREERAAMCAALQKPWGRAMAPAKSQLPPSSPLTEVVGQRAGWKNSKDEPDLFPAQLHLLNLKDGKYQSQTH